LDDSSITSTDLEHRVPGSLTSLLGGRASGYDLSGSG